MSVAAYSTVPINELVLLPELSPRARLCEETVIRYMESFPSLPPVRVQKGTNVVVDGYHRVEAAIRLGMEEIPANQEPIPDEELKLAAGVANVAHGQPLTRAERNALAVALVRSYGKLREEVGQMLGMSASAVTLALREHQYNEMLSEKLGSPVQVINSAHVRALYRVGPDQRERLLEAVVSKTDEDGQPYPLTGAELKLLVDRMLDPATPSAELNRLLSDPKARPKAPAASPAAAAEANGAASDPFMPEPGSNTRPWEREWDSPLKGGDSEAFDRVRGVDEEIVRAGGAAEERQLKELLRRAEDNADERARLGDSPFWGSADAPGGTEAASAADEDDDEPIVTWAAEPEVAAGAEELREGIVEAARALEELAPMVQPDPIRRQVEGVITLLQNLL